MQIRSTFSEGLESELPSSLPFGYPFYATDKKRLYVGRGDSATPEAIRSDLDVEMGETIEDIIRRLVIVEDTVDLHIGDIGSKAVDESTIGDGMIPYYDVTDNKYKFIDPVNITGGTSIQEEKLQQVTLMDVVATKSNPHKIYIDIPYTVNYNRRPLEILKFLEAQSDVTTIPATYGADEASQFISNPYILFDGEMKLQTNYSEVMRVVSEAESSAIYSSSPIDFEEFKLIEELQVVSSNPSDQLHTLIQVRDTHYSFIDSEWIDTRLEAPTGIEFLSKGMTDLRTVTNVTTNARFTLKKVREEETGSIFETTIDVNLIKKISKIKVRQ